jgi:uncharacterized membrane protein
MPPSPVVRPPSASRSLVKALTYRAVIMCADAAAVYLFTGKWQVALGFMIASNIYTTVFYVAHERVWAHIAWGRGAAAAADPAPKDGGRPGRS